MAAAMKKQMPRTQKPIPQSDQDKGLPKDLPVAAVEPLALTPEQAASLLGLSRSMFFKMAESGQIGPMGRRFGRCLRYGLSELRAWVSAGMPPRHEWERLDSRDSSG